MNDCGKEKELALADLEEALCELCSKINLTLRDRAMALQAIEKIIRDKYDAKP